MKRNPDKFKYEYIAIRVDLLQMELSRLHFTLAAARSTHTCVTSTSKLAIFSRIKPSKDE